MNAEPSRVEAISGEHSPDFGARLSVTIPSDADALAAARERVREHLRDRGVDDKAAYAIDFALEELAGNVLRYGYPPGDDGAVRIEVAIARALVRLSITDDARPFDPTLHPEPPTPRSLGEARIGGRGISMVRRIVRAMRYRREPGLNRLEVDVDRA